MNLVLREISAEEHARSVLPISAAMWRGRRDEATYIAQTLEIARSGYGRKYYRLFGLFDGGTLAASFKRYTRTLHFEGARLRAHGIGAVFTPPEMRGRGYASVMLGAALDAWRADGVDVGYLFSDIGPTFYESVGFAALPSRSFSLRADALSADRIVVDRLQPGDWAAIARTHAAVDRTRAWGFERSPLVWGWIRLRVAHGSEHQTGAEGSLVVRRGREVAAYVLGVRAPEHDAFIVDEYGYAAQEDAALVAPLLRAAAGDLGRLTGWLPPDGWRSLLPRGAVRARKLAIFMAAPLTPVGARWLECARAHSNADGVWAIDHV